MVSFWAENWLVVAFYVAVIAGLFLFRKKFAALSSVHDETAEGIVELRRPASDRIALEDAGGGVEAGRGGFLAGEGPDFVMDKDALA